MNLWNDLFRRLVPPLILVLVIAICYNLQVRLEIDPAWLGVHPLDGSRWWGIFTSPFVHGSVSHLLSNLLSMAGLFSLLFLFYDRVAVYVSLISWVATGLAMFLFARPGYYHIGASGVIYAINFFLLFAGFFSRDRGLRMISLIVALYYGGMIWGLLPLEQGVSWDGHISGAVVGLLLAWLGRNWYRKDAVHQEPEWMKEDEEGEEPDEYRRFGSGREKED